MARLTLGVVSNCWSVLLADSSLEEQCRRARDHGYGYVELRQRALGGAEVKVDGDDRPWPLPDRLGALREQVPDLGYNLAVEAPFMTMELEPCDAYLARCADAALALGGPAEGVLPVLRLVDLSPASELTSPATIERLAPGIASFAYFLAERGIRLALENSRQPVRVLRELIRAVAARAGDCCPAPQICWDPANQIAQSFASEDPAVTGAELRSSELFEFHFKQVAKGQVLGDVREGDLDWAAILDAVRSSDFHGPALYEIPGGPDIWERLERSDAYLQPLLAGMV